MCSYVLKREWLSGLAHCLWSIIGFDSHTPYRPARFCLMCKK
jgi:hypothetical protein